MPLSPGTRIGVYSVETSIGAGGMGEVYRARDTRLDRDVALKVLPDLFTTDPERLARFEREAKVLASLNHPNIAQVYGFEPPAAGSPAAMAMEFVDGPTLQQLLEIQHAEAERPGLPLDRALAIARQIATALEAAHEQGIIHRDLKPANVKVREDGMVKVLDFGLAKAFAADPESVQSAVAQSPTLTARSTQLGVILGTAAYMAPEQARGRQVDRRADVWAFGVVLFEMLAGRRTFEGDDVSDVLASVLKSDPDWSALPSDVPDPLRRLLRRCLEKDPKKRLRDIAEGMLQVEEGLASGSLRSAALPALPDAASARGSAPLWRRALPIAATAVATSIVIASVGMIRREGPVLPPAVARFDYVPERPLMASNRLRDVAVSADGRLVAYSISDPPNSAIHLRSIDSLQGQPVRGTAGGAGPFFSPDGAWLGYQPAPDTIAKVPITGGPATPLTKSPTVILGTTWTQDGIVFGTFGGPLRVVSDQGGAPAPLTTLDVNAGETAHTWPVAIPGTSVVVFAASAGSPGTPTTSRLAAIDRATARTVRLDLNGSQPAFLSTGHLAYALPDGSLRAVRFDPARLAVEGTPVPILEGVGRKPSGAANYDIGASGTLVYSGLGADSTTRTLTWVDRSGRETPIAAPARNYFYVRVSPDGSQLSLDVRDFEQDIWIWDIRRETIARLTDQAGADQYGLWTPDRRVIFASLNDGGPSLFVHRADGVGRPQPLNDRAATGAQVFPNAVTPDGKGLIYRAAREDGKNDLFLLSLDGDHRVRPLLATPHDERNAAVSPDGRFMAFESDMTGGRLEVFVRPLPDVDAAQYKVSVEGGEEPVWSPDGRELFYRSGPALMAVSARMTPAGLELGRPQKILDVGSYFFGGIGRNYDVSPDGRRFAMVKHETARPDTRLPITIVLNWVEELRSRLK